MGSIGQVPSDNDRNFAFTQFFFGNPQGIRFSIEIDHDGCIHGNLQSPSPQHAGFFVLGQVPRSDAFRSRAAILGSSSNIHD